MQLFDGHVATIKAVTIQINVNRFLVKNISKTISSHLKLLNLRLRNINKSGRHFEN